MKSKLLMLIISSFVFVGCTDSKDKYAISATGANAWVLDKETGQIVMCEYETYKIYCSQKFTTHENSSVTASRKFIEGMP